MPKLYEPEMLHSLLQLLGAVLGVGQLHDLNLASTMLLFRTTASMNNAHIRRVERKPMNSTTCLQFMDIISSIFYLNAVKRLHVNLIRITALKV